MNTLTLSAVDLTAGYNDRPVVEGISLLVRAGSIVLLAGANGVGKSTTLSCIGGRIGAFGGSVMLGSQPIRRGLRRRARSGLIYVPQERLIFRTLTTRENLRLSTKDVGPALEIFPELEAHLDRRAGLLSGGQQQMLSISMALGRQPRFLLIDELTLGLAPVVVDRLLEAIRSVASDNQIGVLLVEQHIQRALRVADYGYVLSNGSVAIEGDKKALTENMTSIEETYLGIPSARYQSTDAGLPPRGPQEAS